MCNRARLSYEPETLRTHFGAIWQEPPPNRNPIELAPRGKALVVLQKAGGRIVDQMSWDVLGGLAPWPMTNVRNLALPAARRSGCERRDNQDKNRQGVWRRRA